MKGRFSTGWGRYIIQSLDVLGEVLIQWLGVMLLLIVGASYMDVYRGQPFIEQMSDAQMTEFAQGMIMVSIVILLIYHIGRGLGKLVEWLTGQREVDNQPADPM